MMNLVCHVHVPPHTSDPKHARNPFEIDRFVECRVGLQNQEISSPGPQTLGGAILIYTNPFPPPLNVGRAINHHEPCLA